jgi:hypothetical protein
MTDDHSHDRLDAFLAPAADAIAASIMKLAVTLAELDLIDSYNPGTPRWNVDLDSGERVDGIEALHPTDGMRLYSLLDPDLIIATRVRPDGRYEHAVLDENGMPIEWRSAYRPELN